MNSPQPPSLIRFATFELDLRARELRKRGRSTALPEQSITVLAMLLKRPGELVLREEIRNKLWPNDTVVEFDHSINTAIGRLRLVLGDSAENPQYIETLPRRGYRWIGPVVSVDTREKIESSPVAELESSSHLISDTNLIGKKVSHYRVLEVLGGGGMGVVYKAEDLKLGRRVALKFLPEELASDSGALQRFESEARSASALNHPNVCTIYSVEEYEGQPFLAMELLDGQTLRDLIVAIPPGKPPLELSKLLDLAVQITAGLEGAHRRGIIHRDIKPANIFITSHGQAKVLDFGLAKVVRAGPATAGSPTKLLAEDGGSCEPRQETASLTASSPFLSRTGVAMGTAGYMSPEQVRGEKLDTRTDLFSFGLVLYEMATGKHAFPGETRPVLQESILKHTPSLAQKVNPEVPAKLDEIISKALVKDRESRYQTASEMRADLEALKRDLEPKLPSIHWSAKAAAGVAVLFVVSATFWFAKRQRSSPPAVPDLKLRQLTTNSTENRVTSGAISPDGKYLAYTDPKRIYVKLIETGETQAIPQPGVFRDKRVDWEIFSWFPDGTRFLANAHPPGEDETTWTSRGASVWAVSVLGGAPHKLREEAYAYSISRDGSTISFGTNKGKFGDREIWLMRQDGEQARKLYDTDESSAIGGLLWSPDGQRVIYGRTDESGTALFSRDLKGGRLTTLLPASVMNDTTDFSWLPDGRFIYSLREPKAIGNSSCNYWVMRLDARTGEPIEKPRRLTNWGGSCMSSTSATADSKKLTFSKWTNGATVYVADVEADGSRIINPWHFTLDEGFDFPQDWTADGKAIVFASNRAGQFGIYKQSLNEDKPEAIFTGTANFADTRVSPDGKWVISIIEPRSGDPSEPGEIMRVPITGGSPELIFPAQAHTVSHIFCAKPPSNLCAVAEATEDRKAVIITSFDPIKGRGTEVARFDLDPGLNEDSWLCDISPDGTRLAVSRGPEGPIRILSLRGQPTQVIQTEELKKMLFLYWAADGKGLYVSNGVHGGTLSYIDLHGRAHVLWGNYGGNWTVGLPSRDGRHLAILGSTPSSNIWMMENF
jgi:eukaryotic-like serine/threonine-protein kinase